MESRIKSKKTFFYKILFSFLALIISFIISFLYCNFNLLKSGNYGDFDILNKIQIDDSDDEIKKYYVDLGDIYVKKVILNYSSENNFDITMKVVVENTFGSIETKQFSNNCFKEINVFSKNIDKKILSVSFDINSLEDVKLDGLTIKNNITFNYYLFVLVFIILIVIEYCCFNFKNFQEKLYVIFLLISLGVGSVMCISEPALTGISFDDESHYKISSRIASNYNESIGKFDSILYSNKLNFKNFKSSDEIKELNKYLNDDIEKYSTNYSYDSYLLFSHSAHIPGALLLKILKFFGTSNTMSLTLWRLLSLLFYSIVFAVAIKIVKKFKPLFFIFALIPTSVFLAFNYSYDAFLTSLLGLAAAFFINIMCCKKIKLCDILGFIICTFVACLSKAVYMPLLLLMLLIPNEKFNNEKQSKRFKIFILILTFIGMLAIVLPMILKMTSISDQRGGIIYGGEVDGIKQVKLFIKQPLSFALVFSQNFLNTILFNLFSSNTFINMGYYFTGTQGTYYYLFIASLIIIYLLSCKEKIDLDFKKKIFIFLIILFTSCMVYGSMFLIFSPVGTSTIYGVQPRYFIPIVLWLFIILISNRISFKAKSNLPLFCVIILILLLYSLIFIDNFLPFVI